MLGNGVKKEEIIKNYLKIIYLINCPFIELLRFILFLMKHVILVMSFCPENVAMVKKKLT